ncbi:hypothetical protein I551_7759 [Mycobacterium ulcerans str. Harvey]|uniref:Uncharacterized protein n=1 Tax=Mycobacterium ulcerans str. Harvey TaxID=1299332 RepID=A0ABP3A7T4_MYCUL|nr:hypothetical protein I551_7759 [Mycobacterium ulcerans str. Harvey]
MGASKGVVAGAAQLEGFPERTIGVFNTAPREPADYECTHGERPHLHLVA